jgi:hypothetical protein
MNIMNSYEISEISPMFMFTGLLFVYISFYIFAFISTATKKGDLIFQMSDVNLMFVSPISSRKILLYGILRMAKASFLAGLFILFMGNLFAGYGINYGGVLLTFFGVIISVCVLSIMSLIVYNFTNGNKRRKLAAKITVYVLFAPAVISYLFLFITTENFAMVIDEIVRSPFFVFIPIAGWMSTGISAIFLGEMAVGFMFIGANVLLGILLTVYIMRSKPDYYEDTLVSTETAYEKMRALSEGNLNAVMVKDGKVKIKKTGISGKGASALFYKHIREAFRESKLGIFTTGSLIICGIAVAAIYFTKDILLVMIILMGLQIFAIGMSRGLKELFTHYVYMIPETSFNKIIWSNVEAMVKDLIESILIFILGGLLIGESIGIILGCIFAFTMFTMLLIGSNYLYLRFTGDKLSKGLLILFYYLALVIIMLPGLIPAMIIAAGIEGAAGVIIGLIIFAVWELIAGLILFALSKGVLHNCDMPKIETAG